MHTDEYFEKKGLFCPSCGKMFGRHIMDGKMNTATDNAIRSMECQCCDATWADTFSLTGFIDLNLKVPEHFRLVLIRNSAGWDIITDARWHTVLRHCDGILRPGGCDYAEYRVDGLIYRMIRVEDAAEYGIDEIAPEWALNPEGIA